MYNTQHRRVDTQNTSVYNCTKFQIKQPKGVRNLRRHHKTQIMPSLDTMREFINVTNG